MKRLFYFLILVAPASALAWGCLELPTKAQKDTCWEKLQIEVQKPTSPEQKAIEEQNAREAKARLQVDLAQIRELSAARAERDQLDSQERMARELAFLRTQPYPPLVATPRTVVTYGFPLYYRPPVIHHHYSRISKSSGAFRRL